MSTADLTSTLVSIAIFGAIGALSRYFCSFLPDYMGIPIGTATVNICGSFLARFATSLFLSQHLPYLAQDWIDHRFSGSIYDILDIFSRQCKTHSGTILPHCECQHRGTTCIGCVFMALLGCIWDHDAFKGKIVVN